MSFHVNTPKKKKKVDYDALNSSFMRIPRMRVAVARSLLDLGFKEIFELSGRCPNSLFQELKKIKKTVPTEHLHYFRLAVYFSENPDPDAKLLCPEAWTEI